MHTARPIPEGKFEVGTALNALVTVGTVVLPTGHAQMRYGLSENMDFGVRLYPIGLAFDLNVMLMDVGDVAVSISPTIEPAFIYLGGPYVFIMKAWATVLMDVRLSETATLVLGLKPGFMYAAARDLSDENEGDELVFMPGGVLGVRIDLGKFAIMPEINGYALNAGGRATAVFEVGVGIFIFK